MADFSANSEGTESRSSVITKEGINVTRKAKITAAEYEAGTYPVVGEAFPSTGSGASAEDLENLRAIEVETDWISNSTVQVRVLYSTIDNRAETRRRRADHFSSTMHSFDFSLAITDIKNVKIKDKDDNDLKWATVWAAAGTDRSEEDAPPLDIYIPSIVYTATVYLSKWNWNAIRDAIGTVNESDFLKQFETDKRTPKSLIEVSGDDTGQWLFYNFNFRSFGKGVEELVYTFIFNTKGKWNEPEGVTFNLYKETNFNELPAPTIADDTQEYPFGGRVP